MVPLYPLGPLGLEIHDPRHIQLKDGTRTALFAHPQRPHRALLASPHPRGLVGTPLGTGHAGALATVALDHAHPRGCAMAVGVLWNRERVITECDLARAGQLYDQHRRVASSREHAADSDTV